MNSGCSNPSHEMEHTRAKCFAFIFLSLTLSFQKKMENRMKGLKVPQALQLAFKFKKKMFVFPVSVVSASALILF